MRPLHKIYCLILLGFWQSGRLLIAYPESEFSGFTVKSGNTTFLVGLHFDEASKETLEDKLKKLIRKDVEADNF